MRDVGRRVLLGSLVGLAAVVSACSDDDGSPAESAVVVERLAEELVVRSSSLTASVRLSSYRLAIHSDSVLRTTESDGGGPFYERGGVTHVLTRVGTDRPLADGV